MTPEFSRLFAVLLTIFGLSVVAVFGIFPAADHLSERSQYLDGLAAEKARLETLLARSTRPAAGNGSFSLAAIDLGTGAPGIVAAELEGQVRRIFSASGLRIQATEILPEIVDGDVRRIRLLLTATIDSDGLADVVESLGQVRPWTGIEDLQVLASASRSSEGAPELSLRLTIYGLALIPGSEGT